MNNFLKKNVLFNLLGRNNTILVLYFIIILFIIIITLNKHQEEDIEHFISFTNYNNKNIKYSECKKKCDVKYEDPEKAKTCKKYCKCKKKCLFDKKCLKECRKIKNNINRDDKEKTEKKMLQKELRKNDKKELKKQEIEQLREQKKIDKDNRKDNYKKESYVTNIINKYFSEKDKLFLVDYNNGVKNFFKEGRSIFKF